MIKKERALKEFNGMRSMKDVQFIETCPAFKSPIFCSRNLHRVCLFTKAKHFFGKTDNNNKLEVRYDQRLSRLEDMTNVENLKFRANFPVEN